MFTGIVEEMGKVKKIALRSGLMLLEVGASKVLEGARIGDSIAVNGVCLTVTALKPDALSFEVMRQTFEGTTLSALKTGQAINLERSLKAGDRLSGHFVYGHVDCVGLIRRKTLRSGVFEFEIAVEPDLARYCLPKGSIAVDGVSLTLSKVKGNVFTVSIIPHTLKNTVLGVSSPSGKVNIEFDMLAKSSLSNLPLLLRK